MEWWKAAALGTLVYVAISLVLSLFAFVLGIILMPIPIIGVLLALILNLFATFSEAVFSGFIAGNLCKKNKTSAGFLSGLFGSVFESFFRSFLFTILVGLVSSGNLEYLQIPVEFLIEGGLLGTAFISIIGIFSIIIACFGGYVGVKVSMDLPISRIRKELKKIKVPGQ
jgi:hypothetical protein